jgi:hypothetical protein
VEVIGRIGHGQEEYLQCSILLNPRRMSPSCKLYD